MSDIATQELLHHDAEDLVHAYGFTPAFLPLEPKTQREAYQRKDKELWIQAERKEFETLIDMGSFTLVDRPPLPDEYHPCPCRYVYKLKIPNGDFEQARHKARLVLQGDLMTENEYVNSFAPTARMSSVRMLTAIAAQEKMSLKKFDLTGAFLVADMVTKDGNPIYVEIPGLQLPPDKALRLNKALYGGKSSGALYMREITTWLQDYGFKPTSTDETLFILKRGDSKIILSLYIDDGLCATNDEKMYNDFITALGAKYQLSDKRGPGMAPRHCLHLRRRVRKARPDSLH